MTPFSELLRLYWLPGLNEVSGRLGNYGVREWISEESFQVYDDALQSEFELGFAEPQQVCKAYAAELTRMASASIESISAIYKVRHLPKSKAWAAIQWYYSGFYAAHSLLRMFGESIVYLEQGHARSINRTARLYAKNANARKGYFIAKVDIPQKLIRFSAQSDGTGSHNLLWRALAAKLKVIADDIVKVSQPRYDQQELYLRLEALLNIMNTQPCNDGAWLSYVRNRISYRHEFGAWFPYSEHDEKDLVIFSATQPIPDCPELVDLPSSARPIELFHAACRFLVALSFSSIQEMQRRCPSGNSFHKYGVLRIANMLSRALEAP